MAIHNYKPMGPGERFGFWTTVGRDAIFRGKSKIRVVCDCGRDGYVRLILLRSGKSRGCTFCGGMWRRKLIKIGDRAGNWIVVSGSKFDGHNVHTIEVECSCGGAKRVMPAGAFRMAQKRNYVGGCDKCSFLARQVKRADVIERKLWGILSNANKKRGQPLGINPSQLKAICLMNCYYCGVPPSNIFKETRKILDDLEIRYSGIDEVSHGKGHVLGNLLPCCIDCNKAKNNHSLLDFCDWYNRRRPLSFRLTPEKITMAAIRLGKQLQAAVMPKTASAIATDASRSEFFA